MPEKQGGYTKFSEADKGLFSENSDTWWCLNSGAEVTVRADGTVADVWYPIDKQFYDNVAAPRLDEPGENLSKGSRDTTYEMPPDVKDIKDMTEAELMVAGKEVIADMSTERDGIRAVRRHYDDKNRQYKKIRRELYRITKQGYQRRYYVPKKYPVYTATYRSSIISTSGVFLV